jgi:hypothetical protein
VASGSTKASGAIPLEFANSDAHFTNAALTSGGQLALEPAPLPDLLMHYVLNVSEGSEDAARRRVELAIEALG